ncbi:MAG: hypothetical protein ACK4LB_11305 [Spirosomataceae bacterium]
MKKLLYLFGSIIFIPFLTYSQIKIGDNSNVIDPSLLIEVESTNKGVLFSRVNLASSSDQTTISNPKVGTVVYNLGSGGLSYKGYVFWTGSEWRGLNSTIISDGSVNLLNCSSSSLTPSSYVSGVPYSGVLTIPYSGSNGGAYPEEVLGPVNGLTATRSSGNLQVGTGVLSYIISGTPTVSSPSTTVFNVSIGGSSCSVTVGQNTVLGIGQSAQGVYLMSVTQSQANPKVDLRTLYPGGLPVIDGLEIGLVAESRDQYRPRIRNVSSSPIVISFQTFASQVNQNRTELNITLNPPGIGTASSNFTVVDQDDVVSWTSSAAEVITTNLQVQVGSSAPFSYKWYRFEWWAMEVNSEKKIFLRVTRLS